MVSQMITASIVINRAPVMKLLHTTKGAALDAGNVDIAGDGIAGHPEVMIEGRPRNVLDDLQRAMAWGAVRALVMPPS
jgi:hypothetical protein